MNDAKLCACGTGLPELACCSGVAESALDAGHGGTEEIARLLGDAQAAIGRADLADAARLCTDCLLRDPACLRAVALLASIRREEQNGAVAIALMRRFVAINPSDPKARLDLALLLLEAGDLRAGEIEARACLRLSPDQSSGHRLMANVMSKRLRAEFAEWHCREALRLDGPQPDLLDQLAAILAAQGKLVEARGCYRSALAISPTRAATLVGLAKLEMIDGEHAAAETALNTALALEPSNRDGRLTRARLLSRTGKVQEAIVALDDLIGSGGTDDPRPGFEKGRLLDGLGRYDDAWETFCAARRDAHRPEFDYRSEDVQMRVAALRAFFTRARMALLPRASRSDGVAQPIFIMGFPRSGTTLVEQILSSHSQVSAGDELPVIDDLVTAMPRMLNVPLPYPAALTELWMGDQRHGLDALRDEYLYRTAYRGLLHGGNTRFTDKMPLNEIKLPLICMLFPHATRIRLVRHPLDVVLSVCSHWMGFADNFDASLEDAARHYVVVSDLMDHYRAELGEQASIVRYESLVTEPETEIRRLLDIAGLPFEEACLRAELNRRRARTPSSVAVREKINARAVFRYKNYRRHLEPASRILEPTISKLGYDI
jgi:Tfp pilus assembly protein PilF